ncbi:MAG: fumarylacetoacetate hydrolase family protein [bacterium]|nr:fumarylacetoacetate hydrolase family protein [bacterium]MDE0375212.1 fumarylacetoacetate hydrolase family protein [bacterium]
MRSPAAPPLDRETISQLAGRLDEARRSRTPTTRLTDDHPGLTEADAYAIADRGVSLRVDVGERVVGAKLGFTSAAMRQAMGVDSPNYGWLTDPMIVSDGQLSLGHLIHPKAEPEIAFVLGEDLEGAAVSAQDVLSVTAYVMPVIEVVDSRFAGFRFRELDNTSDNSSAGMVVLGRRATRPDFDLSRVGVVVTVNGELFQTSSGAAALGHPAASVAWLVRRLARSGRGLEAGHLIISGGLTGPVDLLPGTSVVVEIDRLGSVSMRVHE